MKKASPKRAASTTRSGEWMGGIGAMPAFVTGEGEPYRPEILFWIRADGALLGHVVDRPGLLVAAAAQSLRDTAARPAIGAPHTPARVRVASPDLAAALHGAIDGVEIVCAPTPEVDEVLASIRGQFGGDAPEPSYLAEDHGPAQLGAAFAAAAALFRARPWKVVPNDEDLIAVTIESMEVRDMALSVIGQMGQNHGLVFFQSAAEFEQFADAAHAIESGGEPHIPRHFALSYEPRAELSPLLVKEVSAHSWPVAGPDAYPWFIALDGLAGRNASARELRIIEAVARALIALLGEKKALLAAWEGGPTIERTQRVRTHGGELEVTLRVPIEPAAARPRSDLLGALFDLGREGELEEEARKPLESELCAQFASSPEGRAAPSVGASGELMYLAANYCGATIATLEARDLREIVFFVIPRKVAMDASGAGPLIEELRAFYRFLEREHGLSQAPACLRVLSEGAEERLRDALSDPSQFGMAKSLLMGASEAGFDVSTEEGLSDFLRSLEGQPLPPSLDLPPASGGARAAKKGKRKAASKARKKNR